MALLLTFAMLVGNVTAQTIKGNVTDSSGEPVIGATVMETGTSNGTVTDIDGNFTLSVKGKELTISYIGMKTQKVNISGKQSVNVVLEDESSTLNDVVVIGYGTARKKDLTGSVSTVKGQELTKVPVPNVSEALTGKMAGVHVTTTDGSPDAEILIRVRGGGSITGDNSPLYVVDGFQTESISDISPNDIEDITVLKDASSTAIYGSQGANGVILITTKNAKSGKTQVTYNGFIQTKTVSKRLDPMDTYDYVMSNYEYALIRGTSSLNSFYKQFGVFDDLYLYKSIEAIDWQEDMFGADVLSHSHNVGLTGGTDKTKFSLSGTYDYNGGLMPDNDFSRFAFMFKLNHDISKNLKFNLKANVSDQLVNGQGTQGGTYKIRTTQAISSVATKGLSEFITPDFASMTDEEYEEWQDSQLTLAEQAKRYWRKRNNRKYGFNASLDWTIIKGLKAHVEGGYEYQFNETKNWWGHTTNQASYVGGLPLADWTKVNVRTIRESVNLSYDKRINTDHHLNVMVGQEYRNQMQDQNYMYGTRYSKSMSPDDVFANFASQGDGAILRAESTVSADVRLLDGLIQITIAATVFPRARDLEDDVNRPRPPVTVDEVDDSLRGICARLKEEFATVDPNMDDIRTGLYDAWRVYDNMQSVRETKDGREARNTTSRFIRYNLERLKEFGCFTETRYAGKQAWQPTRRYNVLVQELAASRLFDEVMKIKNAGSADDLEDVNEPLLDSEPVSVEDWGREFRDDSVEIDPMGDALPKDGVKRNDFDSINDVGGLGDDESNDSSDEDV